MVVMLLAYPALMEPVWPLCCSRAQGGPAGAHQRRQEPRQQAVRPMELVRPAGASWWPLEESQAMAAVARAAGPCC